MSEAVSCPICDRESGRPWGIEYKGHAIVKCAGCGLRYVSPRRTEAENLAVYDTPEYFAVNLRQQAELGQIEHHVRTQLKCCLRMLAHSTTAGPTLLDVGTGTGLLPKVAKVLGFRHVAASDLTDANRATLAALNIPLLVGDVTALPPEQVLDALHAPEGFEVVSLSHVLEHVMDPGAFLHGLRRLLARDGLLYLLVPNEGSVPSRLKSTVSRLGLRRKAFKHLSPGHHLYFYTRSTLRLLLEKHGFAVLHVGTRAAEKPRGPLGRLATRLADALGTGSWLEVVARATR